MRQQFSRYNSRKARQRRFGSGAYHADAVHFDAVDSLDIASLTCTSNEFYSFSFWLTLGVTRNQIYVADFEGNAWPSFDLTSGASPFSGITFGESSGADNFYCWVDQNVGAGWYHILGSFDAPGTFKCYINDIDKPLQDVLHAENAFDVLSNGFPFKLNNGTLCDLADVWIAPGVSLLVDGDIPEVTRRKFISAAGKPVDLGADGSTPTGTAPAIFFSGDAAAFVTNRGTGGAFTLTGSLTDADSSPSD